MQAVKGQFSAQLWGWQVCRGFAVGTWYVVSAGTVIVDDDGGPSHIATHCTERSVEYSKR